MSRYQLTLLSEAVSPIAHMARTQGNEGVAATEQVMTSRGMVEVPVLSGNALRHKCVREPGVRWLIDLWGLAGKLTLPQLNFLLHGGNLTEGGGAENTSLIAELQEAIPLLRLLGGAVPSQILKGSLLVGRGLLVCEENRAALSLLSPSAELPSKLQSAESFRSRYQYVRGDVRKTAAELAPRVAESEEPATNLGMIAGQAVMRGALYLQDFTLPYGSDLELGALVHSLSIWQSGGGTIGGMSARGHGRLKSWVVDYQGETDLETARSAYIKHSQNNADRAKAWLASAFVAKAKGPKPKAAKGKGKAESAEAEVAE